MITGEEEIEVTPSCGNVFADLNLPDPELLLAKAKLCVKISRSSENDASPGSRPPNSWA